MEEGASPRFALCVFFPAIRKQDFERTPIDIKRAIFDARGFEDRLGG